MLRLLALLLLLLAPAVRAAPPSSRDRQAILAMAGTFAVTFDMRETVAFVPDYALLRPSRSGGHEVVRVLEDAPGRIVLQHLLVVGPADAPVVVKHWRQDWTWEPRTLLTYAAPGRWTLSPVRGAGRWSQTVWQTDDSPRYGALGRWRHDDGVSRWTGEETRRPLARRDATRHPPYDHYLGTNRHALTPTGWVHEQDNAKIGGGRTYAHEVLLNSYVRASDFPVAAADRYWAATRDYWAAVRAGWDRRIAAGRGVALAEEAELGSVTGGRLMALADDLAEGGGDTAAAVRAATLTIAQATR